MIEANVFSIGNIEMSNVFFEKEAQSVEGVLQRVEFLIHLRNFGSNIVTIRKDMQIERGFGSQSDLNVLVVSQRHQIPI